MSKRVLKRLTYLGTVTLALSGCTFIEQFQEEDTPEEEETTEDVEQIDERGEGDYIVDGEGNVNEDGQVAVSDVHVDVTTGITEAVDVVDEAVVSILSLTDGMDHWGSFGEAEMSDSEGDMIETGSGSGAVYKVDGDTAYVFTNHHVIEGSDGVEVMFHDGTRVEAEIVGTDVWTDLAVLAVDAEHATAIAEFGDSTNLTVGEPAIAIGSPLGTEFASSVTSGIISGLERTIPVDTNLDGEMDWEMTAIQTDAAINPGNSGGPLINIAGQVIGINSMKISSSQIEGMGFAIPANDAVDVINELEAHGEVIRPVLGVTMVDLSMVSSQERAITLNLPEDVVAGVAIADVMPDSPAEEGGLATYDVLVEFNGVEVENGMQLRQEIYNTEPGDEVEVLLYRDGELRSTTLTMSE